jgi:polyhydroxybutyrate depolymerase
MVGSAAVLFCVPLAHALRAKAPAKVPVGQSTQRLTIGKTQRSFRVYRPAHLASPAPVVVMLHGGFGSARQAETSYGWDKQADSGHFLVIYPDGLDRAWNTEGGGCCGQPYTQHIDDVGFISAAVKRVEGQLPVDARRIYATGISNGGIMDYTLACQSSIFAAIGPDSATELAPCPSPTRLSVIHIHGTADTRIPYDGSPGHGAADIDGPPIPDINAAWRATDGCAAPVITTSGVVTTSLAKCPKKRAVELITIAGAGHQWPGAKQRTLLAGDPPSTALNATQTIWAFFAAHPAPKPSPKH